MVSVAVYFIIYFLIQFSIYEYFLASGLFDSREKYKWHSKGDFQH
jgi:hypothetical protein